MTEQSEKLQIWADTDRQSAELSAMRRMLSASRGTFSLSFAVCNSPALRDYLIGKIRSEEPAIEVVSLREKTSDVYEVVCHSASDLQRSALFLVNLEKSLPSSNQDYPVLRSLNATRELWKKKFSCPVVFWLPEYAFAIVSNGARDFGSWRSHQFEFISEMAGAVTGMQDHFAGEIDLAANLDADQKQFRIAELQQRIAEAGDPPKSELAKHVSVWCNELAFLFRTIGKLDQAEAILQKSLMIDEKLGCLAGMSSDYGELGSIYLTRGDLDQAERMYNRSLEINKKLGRLKDMASNYCNFGNVYFRRGDLDQAERMGNKALEINKKLGRLEGMADDYCNLATVYLTRGDLDLAEQTFKKSLEIGEKLGNLNEMSIPYSNLGLVYQTRGDLDRAEQMYNQALEIDKQLGRTEGIAENSVNLGVIYSLRGDIDSAREYMTRARDLFDRIGMAHGVQRSQDFLDKLVENKPGGYGETE